MRAPAYSSTRLRREGWLGTPRANAQRGLAAARAALDGAGSTLSGDEAMAERERFRCEDEARRTGQGCLALEIGR